jgi:pilus assembly protein Flp/PilA
VSSGIGERSITWTGSKQARPLYVSLISPAYGDRDRWLRDHGRQAERSEKVIKEFCMSRIVQFLKNEDGVTAIEYGLIAAATGLALAVAMPAIETGLGTIFGNVSGQLR